MASEGSWCKTARVMIHNPSDTDTVNVRWLSLDDAETVRLSRWRRMLGESELRRADSFHFASDREAFTAAHALTRAMLSSVTGEPTANWHYVDGEFGKPGLAPGCGAAGLRFNISHTRGLVACAISYYDVGVDIESVDHSTDLAIADTVLAPEEASIVKTAPPERQRRLFFRFWTLKEAFIKATGEGLSRPLDSFSFMLDPVRIKFHPERNGALQCDDPTAWQFAEYRPLADWHLAVAVRRTPSRRLQLDVGAARPEEIAPS
jgi:4'-phosphopantetheinyl transferase